MTSSIFRHLNIDFINIEFITIYTYTKKLNIAIYLLFYDLSLKITQLCSYNRQYLSCLQFKYLIRHANREKRGLFVEGKIINR